MDYKNVDSFIGLIISEGKATYKELKEDYSLEDAHVLYECITVAKANEFLAYKKAKK